MLLLFLVGDFRNMMLLCFAWDSHRVHKLWIFFLAASWELGGVAPYMTFDITTIETSHAQVHAIGLTTYCGMNCTQLLLVSRHLNTMCSAKQG